MTGVESLGIEGIEAIHYYVHDLERSRRFYVDKLDFAEIGESDAALTERGHQRSAVFQADNCVVMCSEPVGEGGRAARYLRKHPDGVGAVIFRVSNIGRTFVLLEQRGGTPIDSVEVLSGSEGWLKTFSITTPFGDTTFRFVERSSNKPWFPGLLVHPEPRGGTNRFGFSHFDHITSNFQTMAPALLWLEHVFGFERYWDVAFHTKDVAESSQHHGSGLRSVVMWDQASNVKFANNEPYRPHFKASQINMFNEEHRGDGIQHVALATRDLVSAVRGLRERGVEFMPTPAAYYELLPERLQRIGVGNIDEGVRDLEGLGILVDGAERHRYLLQIFLKDSADTYQDEQAGPFFYELIHRKGDEGFGAGNFRALFESIERSQLGDHG